jgi:hypothetical protein
LDFVVEIIGAWETIRENIKISAKENLGCFELKKLMPWFDKGCSTLLVERKQAKLQCIQDPSEINGDNLNNVRCEASRLLRNKKREYLNDKINEFATNSMNKKIRDVYRGINKSKNGYKPRNNLVKDENGDLLEDSQNILNKWKNFLSQILNVHNVTDFRQIEVHTKKKLHGLSPRANYTDRATAACQRSDCQLLRIEGAT